MGTEDTTALTVPTVMILCRIGNRWTKSVRDLEFKIVLFDGVMACQAPKGHAVVTCKVMAAIMTSPGLYYRAPEIMVTKIFFRVSRTHASGARHII